MNQFRLFVFLTGWLLVSAARAEDLQFIGPHPERGFSDAVIVGDVTLVHTTQLLAWNDQGTILDSANVAAEIKQVLANLELALRAAQSGPQQIVKLNVYVTAQEITAEVAAVLGKYFATDRIPAVTYVVTRLPHVKARVAMDAVAIGLGEVRSTVTVSRVDKLPSVGASHVAHIPPGSRIYIAGQAEKGATLGEATRRTLESLRRTLEFLGRRAEDVVQFKAFLSPMADVGVVETEFATFFGTRTVPPLVCVEWTSPLIEIELIAWGGAHHEGPAVEFVTPPGMTASPIYSRVARINHTPTVYTSGIFATDAKDAAAEAKDIFGQLERLLGPCGSDFKHLAKATYYCSTNAASQKLNEIRPKYFDPQRPPSASKAMVLGVGREHCELTLDMIAVPTGSRK